MGHMPLYGPGCAVRRYRWTGWPETEWTYVMLFSNLVDPSMNGTGCKGTGGPAELGGLLPYDRVKQPGVDQGA